MRCAMYLRKSRADEESEIKGEFETLSRHRSTLLKIAKEQNLNIVEIKEEVVSGESITYRPKMLELLEEVKQGLYDAVLVMDIDRLGRGNMQDQGLILDTFKKSKTKIITPRKIYDLNNEFDEEYSEFEAFMARKELKLITRRMQRGRIKSVEEGKFIASKAPFGYKFVFDENGKKTMIVDADKAAIVRLIFDLYINKRYGGCKIASYLNALGLKTSTGRTWYDKGVRDILKNKTYAGYVVWNKVERGKNTSRTRSIDERIEAKGTHEAIIDYCVFVEAEKLLNNKYLTSSKRDFPITNPLAGLIVCSECGHKMIAQQSTYKNNEIVKFIKCLNCGKNRGIRLDILEDDIIDKLKRWVCDFKASLKNDNENKKENSKIKVFKTLIKTIEHESETLTKQKENLHNLLEQGIYDIDTYLDRSKALSEKIELNKINLENAKKDLEKSSNETVDLNKLIPKIEKVLDLYYDTDDMQERNDLLKEIIDSINYSRELGKRTSRCRLTIHPKIKN